MQSQHMSQQTRQFIFWTECKPTHSLTDKTAQLLNRHCIDYLPLSTTRSRHTSGSPPPPRETADSRCRCGAGSSAAGTRREGSPQSWGRTWVAACGSRSSSCTPAPCCSSGQSHLHQPKYLTTDMLLHEHSWKRCFENKESKCSKDPYQKQEEFYALKKGSYSSSILFCPRLCPSTVQSWPSPESSTLLCPLLSLPMPTLLPHKVISLQQWSYRDYLQFSASYSPSIVIHSNDVSIPFPFFHTDRISLQ